jgi:hypothetical protein
MENQINKNECCSSGEHCRKIVRIIGMVFVGVIFAGLFALVFGFLVKWLWNYLMPDLFGLHQITYLQAFAMVILAKLLFGAFGPHHPKHHDMHHRPFGKWHDRFKCHGSMPWDSKHDQWKYFSQYWTDEGKEAFEAYIKKSQEQGPAARDER